MLMLPPQHYLEEDGSTGVCVCACVCACMEEVTVCIFSCVLYGQGS